jgi:ABC-type transport system involved in cytochrome c biogenesis ATPase subunit
VRLVNVTVQKFRNFVEPQTFDVESDVTVLVGKNESGKTTILTALHRLNPANAGDTEFDLTTEYPRWRLAKDRRKDAELAKLAPVEAEFKITSEDRAVLDSLLPAPLPEGARCIAKRRYDGRPIVYLRADASAIVTAVAEEVDLSPDDLEPLKAKASLKEAVDAAKARAKELKEDTATALRAKALSACATALGKYGFLRGTASLEQEARDALWAQLPKFFYFSLYDSLPGECDLTTLAAKIANEEELATGENTVVALLAHAGETPADFLDDNYDSRKAELQAASLDLSRHAFEYWRQNTDLSVVFDTDNVVVDQRPNGNQVTHRLLKIELRDGRHGDVETNFATRSTGFQWFFSFFAAFSAYQESDDSIVVLLDEPGTSLHGEAQRDFVRFIGEELAESKQTIYTTHSQFMVDPAHYERLRAVHDRATKEDPDQGVVVTPVSLSADPDTILPVESALGYSVSQHLFIGGGQHLAVEGSSDFVYLQRMTEHLVSVGEQGLDPRLPIIPVGGAGNMPAFVALLGRRLRVSVLIDGAKSNSTYDRVSAAADANGVPSSAIVICADANSGLPRDADIEDLFTVKDYLRLYNWAFDTNVKADQIPDGKERLLRRVETVTGPFDHALPAHALTDHAEEFFSEIQKTSVNNFKSLIELLNKTLVDDEE